MNNGLARLALVFSSFFLFSFKPYPNNPDPPPDWVVALCFLLPFIVGGTWFLYHHYFARKIDYVVFKKWKTFTEDSWIQSHFCLALRIYFSEEANQPEKIQFIKKYLIDKFPVLEEEFDFYLRSAIKEPIDMQALTIWLNTRLAYDQKLKLLYFLFKVAMVDGTMDGREMVYLSKISTILEVSPKDFDSIYASYKQKEQTKSTRSISKENRIKTAARVLGISEFASIDEIKKAYRLLAKKYHPDVNAFADEDEQLLAEERFKEISIAYDYLIQL